MQQKLAEAVYTKPDASKPIESIEELFSHLYDASRVEMQSIPMYLYAAYSIETQNSSQWAPGVGAFRLIKSVVIEEMLHLALARNLIISIGYGDRIHFSDKGFIPNYPCEMLHRNPKDPLTLHLEQLTPQLVKDVFMKFEQPAKKGAPPQSEDYDSLGQFYRAIYDGFLRLAGIDEKDIKKFGEPIKPEKKFEFDATRMEWLFKENRPDLQYVETYWNEGGGGSPIVVHDLYSALKAINVIVEQGEGMDQDHQVVPKNPANPQPGQFEFPHYIKFKRIAEEWEPIGNVYSVPPDPKVHMYPEDDGIRDLALLCNAAYIYTLRLLDELYRTSWKDMKPGEELTRYGIERKFIAAMQGILFGAIRELVQRTIPFGEFKGCNAAPTFEYYEFPKGKDMTQHLREMCEKVIPHSPRLGGDNSVLWLIDKMPELKPLSPLPPIPESQK
ncbi:hypothetical protein CDO52_19710 [Nocardiopsis gilva YIM 90087]|uniref:Iminophenyl-pyruvate dimer synthase domain-containing protein n=1 Tax=Nocardiopsis gilva YIM 90087 TaxID=1235441 RepID=A0A223S9C6_9ACTN|nr:ferritin-like domain-containing protein [Nocardiopsis gilva]ASU84730.1 hypothetical protein CDO52_19710 [Nocardiopsis gilva YIM 90087]